VTRTLPYTFRQPKMGSIQNSISSNVSIFQNNSKWAESTVNSAKVNKPGALNLGIQDERIEPNFGYLKHPNT
jgi:hypothetical protein